MDTEEPAEMAEKRTKSDGFMLRFPDGMRDVLKAAAETNGRSMNAEIVSRLEESFSNEVAHLRGMNEALGRTVRLFVEHLTKSEEGRELILKEILQDEFGRSKDK